MYSPRTTYPDGEPLQAFTAIGVIRGGEVYQVEMASDFKPYRVDVKFLTAAEAPKLPCDFNATENIEASASTITVAFCLMTASTP